MDQAWVDEVLQQLGARYKLGANDGALKEVLYRSGKTDFRPSRVLIGDPHALELSVDIRVPKDAPEGAADPLTQVLEAALSARGWKRRSSDFASMTSQTGSAAGGVRTIKYVLEGATALEAARQLRAAVESIDTPIIVGVHEPHDLSVRDPPPPGPKPARGAQEALELWKFRLSSGVLHAIVVEVDPNERTLRVLERRGLSSQQVGETLKLAQVAMLALRKRDGGRLELVARKRDDTELSLVTLPASAEAAATTARMAKQVRIPLAES